ncbi:MAG TPA: nucleotide exchange factor GrpE, partial [Thermoanaerobaculia bacterium]|nr:nucleotide exchange factor GrpE [Thermoanaerobaculia bacterium]
MIEDTGASVEDIEHEMELAAQEAASAGGGEEDAPATAAGNTALHEEVRKLNDRYLRTLADFENFRKRSEREKADFYRYAAAGILKDILPVFD